MMIGRGKSLRKRLQLGAYSRSQGYRTESIYTLELVLHPLGCSLSTLTPLGPSQVFIHISFVEFAHLG